MVSPEYEAFSKRWFEVIVEQLSLTSELNANLDRTPSPSPYAGYSPWNTRLPYYVDFGSRRSSSKHISFPHSSVILSLSTLSPWSDGEPLRGAEPRLPVQE